MSGCIIIRHCNNIIKDLKSQIIKIQDKIKGITSNTDFDNITKQITKTKERVFHHNKNLSNQKIQLLKKDSSLQEHTSTGHHKKEMGHQLIQQATNRWRASLLQKGPKFAVSSSRVPLTEYIAVTKRICDELGENTTGKTVQRSTKNQRDLASLQKKKSFTRNITKEEREAIKTLREDASHVVLTADKGVALVVMTRANMLINVGPS